MKCMLNYFENKKLCDLVIKKLYLNLKIVFIF